MADDRRRVIVIDDDEVVLVAITELLEAAGCKVFTLTSPIGATQVIVRESIDAAVIDVNLPVMQGDNVIRLFRSWDKVKDLPIVVISGASQERLANIQRELPGVRVVRKDEMHLRLASAVLDALAVARAGRGGKVAPRVAEAQRRASELRQQVAQEIAQLMTSARDVWKQAREGHLERIPALTDALGRLRGQAQLLGLERVASLTHVLADMFVALKHGRRLAQGVDRNVEHAMAALTSLQANPTSDFAFSPDPLTRALRQALEQARNP